MRNALVEFHDMDLVFTKEVCYKIKSHIKKGKHHCQENEVIDAWRNYTDGFMPKYFSKIVGRNWQVFHSNAKVQQSNCVKSVQIPDFFLVGIFPAFGLNMERYSVSRRIQSECGYIRTRKNSVFWHFTKRVIL